MQAPTEVSAQGPESHQEQFHRRWNHLEDQHVRTLAWLLDAPDLLDAGATEWAGRVASFGPVEVSTEQWLSTLDRSPRPLHDYLGKHPFARLGRYAEQLIAFYLAHCDLLFAHGVQVRAGKNDTIGEFDFLLRRDDALVHWEFATKLYLLEANGQGQRADYFVGPNLADTLGAKVRKIMDQQLALSQHPAAQAHLPLPIVAAQALVKGWLFYQGRTPVPAHPPGISAAHCRGFWCALKDVGKLDAEHYMVLPRLSWLAPAKTTAEQVLDRAGLNQVLEEHFLGNASPVLIALLGPKGKWLLEKDRGFIVPDDWQSRAEVRIRRMA